MNDQNVVREDLIDVHENAIDIVGKGVDELRSEMVRIELADGGHIEISATDGEIAVRNRSSGE